MWQIGKLDVQKGIASETTMKMMHTGKQGFAEDKFFTKKCVIKEKLRRNTLDIWIQNLVH